MTDKKEALAASSSQSSSTTSHLTIVSNNPNPSQRWRGNTPLKPIHVSPELEADIEVIAKGGRHDGK